MNLKILRPLVILFLLMGLTVGGLFGYKRTVIAVNNATNLSKPLLISPTGSTDEFYPTYTWNIVPGALEYYLWVNGPNLTGLIKSWIKSTDICSNTQCSVRPLVGLVNGSYKWWVLAKNDLVMSPWSDEASFSLVISLPSTPTAISPTGIITRQPTFTWSNDHQTSFYYLWLNNSTGNILGKWFPTTGICSGSTCTTNLEKNLADDSYRWWVIGWNSTGYSNWSNGLSFTGLFVPDAPEVISPQGIINGPSQFIKPTFSWNSSSGATDFNFALVGSNITGFQANYKTVDVCSDSKCSISPALELSTGDYQWSVQGKNQSGSGPWSVVVNFSYEQTPPEAATLLLPFGEIKTNQPVFRWKVVNGSQEYRLWINGTKGNIYQAWYATGNICGATECEVKSPVIIGEGDHYWWVQTKNQAGTGPWSMDLKFKVVNILNNPEKISPSGEITSQSAVAPSYKWKEVIAASTYILTIHNPDGSQLFNRSYTTSAICSSGICAAQPDTSLENGEYRWYVQSKNETGTSPLGAHMAVYLNRQPPSAATQISPNGGGFISLPSYIWKPATGATWYYLWVNDSQGTIIKSWYLGADVCKTDTCSVTTSRTLMGGQHTWWVQTWNAGGFGPWSPGMIFGSTTNNAPPFSTSWYMDTVNQTTLYTMGCDMGIRDKNMAGTQDSFLVLDFGNPNYSSGVYGTALFGFGTASTGQIAQAVQQYAAGYISCVGSDITSRVKIGIGTNNYGSGTTRNHGAAWAEMVNSVNTWLISKGYFNRVDVVGANDLEIGWNSPSATRAWVDGYDSNNKYPLYNFGDAAGCPTRLVTGRSCGTSSQPNWTLEDIWYISWGVGSAYPFPLIYATSGVNARQWQWLSLYGYTNHGARMDIQGAFTQYQACQQRSGCSGMDNSPDVGWQQMWDELSFDNRTTQPILRWSTDIKWLGE